MSTAAERAAEYRELAATAAKQAKVALERATAESAPARKLEYVEALKHESELAAIFFVAGELASLVDAVERLCDTVDHRGVS